MAGNQASNIQRFCSKRPMVGISLEIHPRYNQRSGLTLIWTISGPARDFESCETERAAGIRDARELSVRQASQIKRHAIVY